MSKQVKIGTRGSPLALKQTQIVKEELEVALGQQGIKDISFEIFPITTSGDKNTHIRLSEIGGKGLFTKEIEDALREGIIDLAVHSMKDVETRFHSDFIIPCMIQRDDVRDAWISTSGHTLATLPAGSRVGTSSLRRTAQILHLRPDLTIVPFRGKVETRLRKLQEGEAEATLLALAGLNRLQKTDVVTEIFDPDVMIPAVGQGALGIQCLKDHPYMNDLLTLVNHSETYVCVSLERAFLEEIDGSCGTPVGGVASFTDKSHIKFIGCVASPDGQFFDCQQLTCSIDDAEANIRHLGKVMHDWLKEHHV